MDKPAIFVAFRNAGSSRGFSKEAAPGPLSDRGWEVVLCTRTGLRPCDECFEDKKRFQATCQNVSKLPRISELRQGLFSSLPNLPPSSLLGVPAHKK